MSKTILIVDDEPVQRRLLESAIAKMGYATRLAEDGAEALDILTSADAHKISVVVLDLMMPDRDGMDVLQEMNRKRIEVPVVVQTAQGGIDTVVAAIRAGAMDFCVKPVSPQRLAVSLQNALKLGAMEEAVTQMRKTASGEFTFADMISASPAMAGVIRLGERAAASNIPVLIEGESGVGKEVIARAILGSSDRKGKPFITVNCGALPENLVESILFGHEKGAFTGANNSHVGKFKEADGGTLFLDEVGELSHDIQVKLLRALQEGEIDPIGAKRPVKTDFRLISATNRDLLEQVQTGAFREDLYYRLNVFPIQVPPLRERREDIVALIEHFTARICLEEGRRRIKGLSASALDLLQSYDWPGNVRQLENTIFRAIILCDQDVLTENEFPQVLQAMGRVVHVADAQDVTPSAANRMNSGHGTTYGHELERGMKGNDAGAEETGTLSMLDGDGDVLSLAQSEAAMIRFAIRHHEGRMTRVAASLGIGRSTLYRKLKEYGISEQLMPEDVA